MAKMANLIKEQCKITQGPRFIAQPESSKQRGNQIPAKTNDMQILTPVFQFGSKAAEGVSNKAQIREVINVPKNRKSREIKKKMK